MSVTHLNMERHIIIYHTTTNTSGRDVLTTIWSRFSGSIIDGCKARRTDDLVRFLDIHPLSRLFFQRCNEGLSANL
jgi:hypothetical protein